MERRKKILTIFEHPADQTDIHFPHSLIGENDTHIHVRDDRSLSTDPVVETIFKIMIPAPGSHPTRVWPVGPVCVSLHAGVCVFH